MSEEQCGLSSLGWIITGSSDAPEGLVSAFDPGLPAPHEAAVRVEAAGFNYKDALACVGHRGVVRRFPLVPGIDLAGWLESPAAGLAAGTPVVVTGNGLGETRHGGFAARAVVPAEAILPLPAGLSCRAAMACGTAGLTALLAADRLVETIVKPATVAVDEWLVTGASGGVGLFAVAVLAAQGRRVTACTRKPAADAVLRSLGAGAVIRPEDLGLDSPRPLLSGRFLGVVDTVGGPLLAAVLRLVAPGGGVAAIGMAGGTELATTVYPFILRGITLAGIDAASLPTQECRRRLWTRLAALWPRVEPYLPIHRLSLVEVGRHASELLAGRVLGRGVVEPSR